MGNILLPQKDVEEGRSYMEAAQAYLDAHAEEVPDLEALPNLTEAGAVIKYFVEKSKNSSSGMVFVENDSEEIASLIIELHEQDNRIHIYDDIIKNLEEDLEKFPAIRDYIEYCSSYEYILRGEPLIHSYTGLTSIFASIVSDKYSMPDRH